MQVPKWRNVLIVKNYLIPALSQSNLNTSSVASIHSTATSCDRSKNKGKTDHVRFAVRQKRADTKKALKHLLFSNGTSPPRQEERLWNFGAEDRFTADKKRHSNSSSQRTNRRGHSGRMKRKFRRDTSGEDSDDPESMFQAKFGNKWYTWSFHQGFASQRSNTESAHWTWKRSQECGNASEPESDRESPIVVGSFSDRRTLGLPLSGPLEIEEVKNAFRESALKWHPDRHQVYSQATAAEKFKLCVSAYKSLCSALS
ncbi:unnamed protein product [Linum tenue]|uniref:J domain-containing protein n=1 Tax=Linum tenue TaxID=586396 RepID=A0AAV0L184_9ROSI|nr:unnamed protein product [Linum tenue]